MKWIQTSEKLPKHNQDVIIQINNPGNECFRATYDRNNPFIPIHQKFKFWIRDLHGSFSKDPLDKEEVRYWIPFPKYEWEEN